MINIYDSVNTNNSIESDNSSEIGNKSIQLRSSIRGEMEWNSKIESLFRHWATLSKENAKKHNIAAKRKKILYRVFGIPSVIIPLIMGSINQIYEEHTDIAIIVNSLGYLISGTLSGINAFMNFSGQYEQHYNAEIRYNEIYTDIQSILIKPQNDRIQADVSIERYKLKIEHINENAPDL